MTQRSRAPILKYKQRSAGRCDKIEQLYSTIGDVQQVLEDRHTQFGVRTSFVQALEYLNAAGRLLREKPEVPMVFKPMSDPSFDALIKRLPVEATQIMATARNTAVITEDKAIPDGKDVFILKHIPYVDDGLHGHNYFEINYMYSGSCVQIFENERRVLKEGDMCIISPFARHNIIVEPQCIALGILMRKSTFDRFFWKLLTQKDLLASFFRHTLYEDDNTNYLFLETDNRIELKYFIQNLMLEVHTDDSYANGTAINLMNVVLAKILRSYSETIQFYEVRPRLHHEFEFSLLLQYVQENYRTVTLQGLAERFHFSEAYLSRRIKQNIGKGFSTLIQELKLSRAVELLQNTNLKVHEISDTVGYDSVDHFSRAFKKMHGATPRDYRKTHQTGDAIGDVAAE